MAKLFSQSTIEEVQESAKKSTKLAVQETKPLKKSVTADLDAMMKKVQDYFSDYQGELITSKDQLHSYIDRVVEFGYAGIDTETTGLDRINDTIVGASLYSPNNLPCYIPMMHKEPIQGARYKGQLSYEEVQEEFQRLVDNKVKLIFANADFDLSMIYKDIHVDMNDVCYYDVILAWRVLKENELHNGLKELYCKYVLKGNADPMKFSDFFSPALFPHCKPKVALPYASNDAKITYELYLFQLPYVTKSDPKCQKKHLEGIADIIWNIEFPMIKVCQNMHRNGIYIDKDVARVLNQKYDEEYRKQMDILADMVQQIIYDSDYSVAARRPFARGKDFNPNSNVHCKYLCATMLKIKEAEKHTDKTVLTDINLPVTNQILKVRSLTTLINTFVKKLPSTTTSDSRIHAQFRSVGADTGRMSSAEPNLQNIPSHAADIRHMFRATPGYVMMSSDYSQQEPKLTAYVSQDEKMMKSFMEGKDIYATIASLAFNLPYEKCLEFHPETGEYQPDGKARRGEAKTIVLGICYGRSVVTIADQLFGKDTSMSDDDKVKKAQGIYDAVLNAFPRLRQLMLNAQAEARTLGYVETILGRRRHIPDMQLPEFEFLPEKGYVNPDIDPLDPSTLDQEDKIPKRIVDELTHEFKQYKYFGQIAKRTRELHEQDKIRVVNHRAAITEASRKCVNSKIQGSAAELTKMAILKLENDPEWIAIKGRLLVPVHDELIVEVPMDKMEDGARILSRCMCEAGSFLPFGIKCDVETTLRWYGLSYPCPYTEVSPGDRYDSLEDADKIKWVQYHLIEVGYVLPVYKDENGEKPRGDAAKGVNGIVSDEYFEAIRDYIRRHRITEDQFFNHIHKKVYEGV